MTDAEIIKGYLAALRDEYEAHADFLRYQVELLDGGVDDVAEAMALGEAMSEARDNRRAMKLQYDEMMDRRLFG